MKRTCIQCGKEFELTNSEIGFYKKRKLSLPKRCKECREQNKKNGAEKRNGKSQENPLDFGKKQQRETDGNGGKKAYGNKNGADRTQSVEAESSKTLQVQSCLRQSGKESKKSGKKMLLAAVLILCAAALLYVLVSGLFQGKDEEEIRTEGKFTIYTEELSEEYYENDTAEAGFVSAEGDILC